MPRQIAIKLPETQAKRRSLHETVLEVLQRFGPRKQGVLAKQLGASDGHLSEVMKGNGGKHWPLPWLDYIAEHYDFEAEIAAHFAEMRGLTLAAPRAWTDAEYRRRNERVIATNNTIGEAWRAQMAAIPDEEVMDE